MLVLGMSRYTVIALLVVLLATAVVSVAETNQTTKPQPPTPRYTVGGFTVIVEGYDVKSGLITLGISGVPGTYYVEIISSGNVVYNKLTSIPGTITVNAKGRSYTSAVKQTHYTFNLIVNIYSADMTKKLYTHGIYIDVYAPKPTITIVGARYVGGKVVVTFRISTSTKTDVTIYVNDKPVVTDTIFTMKDYNVTVPTNKLVNILVRAETDFSVEELPLYLFIPGKITAGGGSVGATTSSIRVVGITAVGEKVRITVTVPEPATVSLQIDGVPYGSQKVPKGTSTVAFPVPFLKPGQHQAVIRIETESGLTYEEAKIFYVQQKQPEIPPTTLGVAVVAILVLGYIAYKKGLIKPAGTSTTPSRL